jgi:hypothetical protein
MLASTHTCTTANASVNYRLCVPQRPCKISIAPMGKCLADMPNSTLAVLLSCSTRHMYMPATLKISHCPDGKVADVLAPTHAHTIANALVNYRGCVLQRPYTFPIAPMGTLLICLPRLSPCNCDQSFVPPGICSCRRDLNFPIAPMGDSRFARCLQGGGVYVSSGMVTITSSSIYGNTAYSVRAHDQKFPLPQWESC